MKPQKGSFDVTRPLFTIPDTWAMQAQCPLCNHKPMQAAHAPNAPDEMVCPQCGLSFEIEHGGSRVRLKDLPPQLRPLRDTLSDQWLTMKEVSGLIERKPSPPLPRSAAAPSVSAPANVQPAAPASTAEAASPGEPISNEELSDRARKLIALGNSPSKVRSIFAEANFPAEQIEAVMKEIEAVDRRQRQSASRGVLMMGSAAGLALLVFIGLCVYIIRSPQFQRPTATPAPTRPPLSIDPAKILAPFISGGANPGSAPLPQSVLPNSGAPTAAAQQGSGPAASKCPTSPGDAAALFGGKANEWKPSDQFPGSWIFISTTATTIRIPAKMTGGYVRGGSTIDMIAVSGPTTLTNVNFATVTCE